MGNASRFTTLSLTLSLFLPLACGAPDSEDTSGAQNSEGTDSGTTGTGATGADSNDSSEEASAGMENGGTGEDSGGDGDDSVTDGDASSESSSTTGGDGDGDACGQACDIWDADSCGEGWKCTAVSCSGSGSWDDNRCREIQGTDAPGDPCTMTDGIGITGNDTCALGSMCMNPDPQTAQGSCVAFCTGSPDAPLCAEGSSCSINNQGVLPLCLLGCDPLAQNCPSGESCLPSFSNPGYGCVVDASGGQTPYGSECAFANACNPGLICANGASVPNQDCSGAACCTPLCNLDGPNDCPGAGQSCTAIFDPAPTGYEHVGLCTL